MLNGERGDAVALAMKLLTMIGDMYEAKKMVKINSAHISGISYKNIGDAGLDFIEDFTKMKAKASIRTTLNPAGMDLKAWKELGVREDFARKQLRIIGAFESMGIDPSCTCTPYLIGNKPRFGTHISWAESSAITYANSVLGARTNREGGPSVLASAITGVTPLYGYHLNENRRPTHRIQMEIKPKNELTFSSLGYTVGKIVKDGVPFFVGLQKPSLIELKALGASLATSGSVALYHIDKVTPESGRIAEKDLRFCEKVRIEERDLRETIRDLSSEEKCDQICIGCPHCSLEELKLAATILSGRRVRKRLWFFTSRHTGREAGKLGYVKTIEKAGARIIYDTCMVVSPLEELGVSGVVVNSCKAAHYIPSTCKLPAKLLSFKDCIRYSLR